MATLVLEAIALSLIAAFWIFHLVKVARGPDPQALRRYLINSAWVAVPFTIALLFAHPAGYPNTWPAPRNSCVPLDGYFSTSESSSAKTNWLPGSQSSEVPLDLFFTEEQIRDLKYHYFPGRISDIRIGTTPTGLLASALDRDTVVLESPVDATCARGELQIHIKKRRMTQNGYETYEEVVQETEDGSLTLHTHYTHFNMIVILPAIESADYRILWRRSDKPNFSSALWHAPEPRPVASLANNSEVRGTLTGAACPRLVLRTDDGTEHVGSGSDNCHKVEYLLGQRVIARVQTTRAYLGLPSQPFGDTNLFYVSPDKAAGTAIPIPDRTPMSSAQDSRS